MLIDVDWQIKCSSFSLFACISFFDRIMESIQGHVESLEAGLLKSAETVCEAFKRIDNLHHIQVKSKLKLDALTVELEYEATELN